MQNFQDIFKTRKRSFISDVSIYITVPVRIVFGHNTVVMLKFIGFEFLTTCNSEEG